MDVHFCPQCTKILSLGRHGDFFSFMGLPRRLTVDSEELERRFRILSRQFHPDYFYNSTPAERRASLERSSYLNDAYRTLRQPMARLEYLLSLELGGSPSGGAPAQGTGAAPASLLEEVFTLNEELDEVRELRAGGAPPEVWRPRLEAAARPIVAKRDEHEAQVAALSTRWDELMERGGDDADGRGVLEALRERVLERNYIANLLAGIERELSE